MYVLVVCVIVGRPDGINLTFLLRLIDARRGDPPGGEEMLGLVVKREQSA